jgi:type II secretory pathway pseudopilin PulG
MMSLKNNVSGFSMIEVLFAMAIALFVLTPIFITQGTFLGSVGKRSRHMARIFFAKEFLIDCMFTAQTQKEDAKKVIEKKIDNPETLLIYKTEKIPEKSSLAVFQDIYIDRVKVQWKSGFGNDSAVLTSFIFKPKLPENKKVNAK